MPKPCQAAATADGSRRGAAAARVSTVARRDQRRAARGRHARAAHHLHGGGADDAARHRREPAAARARDGADGDADLRDHPDGLRARRASCRSTTSRVRVDVLRSAMRQALCSARTKNVFLRGDAAVQIQDLMTVMDQLKDAGVEKVGDGDAARRASRVTWMRSPTSCSIDRASAQGICAARAPCRSAVHVADPRGDLRSRPARWQPLARTTHAGDDDSARRRARAETGRQRDRRASPCRRQRRRRRSRKPEASAGAREAGDGRCR